MSDKITAKGRFSNVHSYFRKLYLSLVLILGSIGLGMLGFVLIEDYDAAQAFYMTIITVSTVGFGEIEPLSPAGRVFTSFLIIFNIGIFAYAISSASSFVLEGELRTFLKDYRVYKRIQDLSQHIIVCGFGRHGNQVVQELTSNQMPFVIIDEKEEIVDELRKRKYLFLEGDATQDELLLQAGIRRAKAIIVTFGEDAENVYTVLTARQLNSELMIIARAMDAKAEPKLKQAGANHIIRSERLGGFYMATLVNQPHIVEFFTLLSNMSNVTINFKEIPVENLKPEYRKRSIKDLGLRAETGANIIGIRHKNGTYTVNPSPSAHLQLGMSLVVLGDQEQMRSFKEKLMI